MDYLPIFLDLKQKNCLVIGGGDIAFRKSKLLLRAGAIVECVAIDFCQEIIEAKQSQSNLILTKRKFHKKDINDRFLIIAATDNEDLNNEVSSLAKKANILVNAVDYPAISSFISPAIVDRNPLIIAISSAGNAPVLARIIRAKIETLIPSQYGKLAKLATMYREKVKSKFKKIRDRRIFWEEVFSGNIAEAVFANNIKQAELGLEEKLSNAKASKIGEIYLVGAGPGDPDLLTFKALRCMQHSDVILYDRLISKEVMELVRRDATVIYVGKKAGLKSCRQENINQQMVELAKQGKKVCRLKGGDPFIFGRGGEEIETLVQENIPFQIVPGITSASGCSAYAGIPLTHRDYSHSCRFVTAHLKDGSCNLPWQELVGENQTIVFYMVSRSLKEISEKLIQHGMKKNMPVALIEKGTNFDQNIHISNVSKIAEIDADKVIAPSLLILGEVVHLHKKLKWR